MYYAGVVYRGPKGVLYRKYWAAGSVMAEEMTPVEMMARVELESAGWVGVAGVERVEVREDGVEEVCAVDEAAAVEEEELMTDTVMYT